MTRRGKFAIGSAVTLAVMVIASSIFLLLRAGGARGMDTAGLVITCGAVLLSILSVFTVYLLKGRKRKYEKLLNDEYYREYEIIQDAVLQSQLSSAVKKEIGSDILDLLLSAQEAGKSVESAVGDPAAFAREIMRAYARPGLFACLSLIDAAVTFLSVVLAAYIVTWLEQTNQSFFGLRFDVSLIAFFALIALIVIPVTKSLVSARRNWAYLLPVACGVAFVITAELLRKYAYGVEGVRYFLDGTVPLETNPTVLIAHALLIPLLMLIKIGVRNSLNFKK